MADEDDLQRWLDDIADGKSDTVDFSFPSDKLSAAYLKTIDQRSDEEIRDLLRGFLIPSGSLGSDEFTLKWLLHLKKENRSLPLSEFQRRLWLYFRLKDKLAGFPPPWEGITWTLDLLPHNPRAALNALETYFEAHAFVMPDGRINGIFDVMEIIRTRYIERPRSPSEAIQLLLNESARTFEHLVERLYAAQDYVTSLTPPSKDGGRDIIAVREAAGRRQKIYIECKRWKNNVGVPIVRALLGVVHDGRATSGICVTASDLTARAKELVGRNPQLDFLSGKMLVRLMNEYLGPTWFFQIERLVADSKKSTRQGADHQGDERHQSCRQGNDQTK